MQTMIFDECQKRYCLFTSSFFLLQITPHFKIQPPIHLSPKLSLLFFSSCSFLRPASAAPQMLRSMDLPRGSESLPNMCARVLGPFSECEGHSVFVSAWMRQQELNSIILSQWERKLSFSKEEFLAHRVTFKDV